MSTVTEQLAALAQIKADIREAINSKGATVTENDPFYIYASKILKIGGGTSTPPTYSPYGTIAEQLTVLNQIKTDIRNAIISKGVSVPIDTPFADYADKILEINLTATGNPVSIVTNKAQNAISTILSYSPKQSGTGDPSPTNIRPIEGWTEADLFGCGKNLFDISKLAKLQVNGTGEIRYRYAVAVKVSNGKYVASCGYSGNAYIYGRIIRNGEYLTYQYIHAQTTEYTPVFDCMDGDILLIFNNSDDSESVSADKMSKIQLEVGQTATAYEPYTQGANITANLGGTYYGGSLDVVTGELTVTHTVEVYDGTEDWRTISLGTGYYLAIDGSMYTKNELLKCSCLIGSSASTSSSMSLNSIMLNASKINLLCKVDTATDFPSVDDWKDFLTQNPMTVLFPLAEPQTVSLTPQTVALLKGANTLWTDGDEITITYK